MLQLPEKLLEAFSKYVVVAVGLAYGMGLLIENLYLSGHGVLSGSLLKSEYILVGLLWLFVTLVPVVVYDAVRDTWRGLRKALRARRYGSVFARALFIGVLPVMGSSFFFDKLSGGSVKAGDLDSFIFILTIISMSAFTARVVIDLKKALTIENLSDLLTRGHLYQFCVNVVFLLGSLTAYARYVHPQFEAAFGGGRREPVLLVLASDAPTPVARLLPRSRRSPGVFGPVLPILETDHQVFFLPRPWLTNSPAIMLPREAIKATIPATELPAWPSISKSPPRPSMGAEDIY